MVFEDGSYEGEVESAATYRGYVIGRKTELKRIVPVLENAVATSASIETLRRQLSALSHDFENDDIAALAKAFPGIELKKLESSVEAGIHGIRKEVFDQLETFKDGQHSEGDFQVWLTDIKEQKFQPMQSLSLDVG